MSTDIAISIILVLSFIGLIGFWWWAAKSTMSYVKILMVSIIIVLAMSVGATFASRINAPACDAQHYSVQTRAGTWVCAQK